MNRESRMFALHSNPLRDAFRVQPHNILPVPVAYAAHNVAQGQGQSESHRFPNPIR